MTCFAWHAQESYKGQGLYPGEAYAPNVPSLIEAAAIVPAPEGAYLVKIANQIAPEGAPQVHSLPDDVLLALPVSIDGGACRFAACGNTWH